MKTCRLVSALVALVLFTSCLSDSDNNYSASGFGVGVVSNGKTLLSTSYGPLYSSSLASQIISGVCYYASFAVDLNSDANENASSNGYYVATISGLTEIEKGAVNFVSSSDTTKLLDNEIVLTNASVGTYLEGYLFLAATYAAHNNQVNDYTLYWDRSSASTDPTDESGVVTYNLFLRVTKATEGTGETTTSTAEYHAYNVGSVVESVVNSEYNNGTSSFNLKVNYLNAINESDSTDLTWNSFTITFSTGA